MDRRKLPVPSKPSGLRPPQVFRNLTSAGSTSGSNATPAQRLIPQRVLRRSKSMTEISRGLQPLREITKQTRVAKPPTLPKVPETVVRKTIKRPISDRSNDNAVAKKVAKPQTQKVATWDYKQRHAILLEKYNNLAESGSKMKGDFNAASAENIVLTEANADLTERLTSLKEDYSKSESALKELNAKLQTYSVENASLRSENADLTSKLNAIQREFEVAKKENTELTEQLQQQISNFKNELNMKTLESSNLTFKLNTETDLNANLTKDVDILKRNLQQSEMNRRKLHNQVQELKGNIRVFCRVRPPINLDEEDKLQCNINFVDDYMLEVRKSKASVVSGKSNEFKQDFNFDRVFTPTSTQEEVFEDLAQLVQSGLDGYHVCVFAYGQTGSGKTFTMEGVHSPGKHGMIPRSIDLVFDSIESLKVVGWTYNVEASFLEIYNENINDLLNVNSKLSYEIKFNEGKGMTVTNLKQQPIKSAQELKKWMSLAQNNRKVAATDFNEHSSRSHAVTKINIEGIHAESKTVYNGSINLVDLAGSESAKTSSNDRIVETKNINKSLSTLGSVMLALYNKDSHIPYRNSKLTYLLQSCLGGNSKTLMFVNISPFEECYNETVNSLRFAAKVKDVKTSVKRNKNFAVTAK